jgi:hypothetical protein
MFTLGSAKGPLVASIRYASLLTSAHGEGRVVGINNKEEGV